MSTVPAPESSLKRALFKRQQSEAFKKAIIAKRASIKNLKGKAQARASRYAREYRASSKRLVSLRKSTKADGNFYLEAKPKIAIVTRIRGIAHVPPKQKKILQLLRLRQIFNTVIVKLNKPMQNMLRAIEPYISYGYPSLSTIRALMYKRAHLKINGQRIRVTDNAQIRDKFNDNAIVCLEDMVHEIYTCGPHFRTVTNGLWPFKLSPPKGGMRQKRRHFIEGGDFGNREELINRFLKRMI